MKTKTNYKLIGSYPPHQKIKKFDEARDFKNPHH